MSDIPSDFDFETPGAPSANPDGRVAVAEPQSPEPPSPQPPAPETVEPAPQAIETVESAPVEQDPQWDYELLARLGMTKEEAEYRLEDPENLAEFAEWHDELNRRGQQRMLPPQQETPVAAPSSVTPATPTAPSAEQAKAPEPISIDKFTLKIDPEEDDIASLGEKLNAMNDYYYDNLTKLRQSGQADAYAQRIEDIEQHTADLMAQQYCAGLDRAVSTLDDDLKGMLPAVPMYEITDQHPQYADAVRFRDALETVRQSNGRLTTPEAAELAARAAFADRLQAGNQQETTRKIRMSQARKTARPTSRTPQAKPPIERAVDASERFDREQGITAAHAARDPDDFNYE